MNARDTILARLRAALADEPAAQPIPRDYGIDTPSTGSGFGSGDAGSGTDLVALLTDRLVDYRARVHDTLADALTGVDRLLVPPGLPPEWLTGFAGTIVEDPEAGTGEASLDRVAGPAQLGTVDAVLTGCAVAIAETGTIVLEAGPGQGRRALTLVPDRHIVVVRPDQIVGRVPAAIRALAARRAGGPYPPLTWISGPSATSDIELIRIEGVHGPRQLDVVISPDPVRS